MLASYPDWSPFSADISICFVVDGWQIDMKFHLSQGFDRLLLSASPLSWNKLQAAPSLLYPFCWVDIHIWCLLIHVSNTGYDMSTYYQVPWGEGRRRTVSVTAWMITNRQLSFSEWWGLIVYASAVGSAASVWAGRVIITFIFIHNLCRTPWHSSGQHLPYILY